MFEPRIVESERPPCDGAGAQRGTSVAELELEADAAYESVRSLHLETEEARWWLGRIQQQRRDLELIAQHPLLARFAHHVQERVGDFAVLAAERAEGMGWADATCLPKVRALELDTARHAQFLRAMLIEAEARWTVLDAGLTLARARVET